MAGNTPSNPDPKQPPQGQRPGPGTGQPPSRGMLGVVVIILLALMMLMLFQTTGSGEVKTLRDFEMLWNDGSIE